MSLIIKRHSKWNVTKKKMLLKMKSHLKLNVTQIKTKFKFKCDSN